MEKELFIPFNKNKTYILLISALIMMGMTLYVYVVRDESLFGDIGNYTAVIILGLCAGIVSIKLIIDLFKKDRGLYFSDEGIKLKDESGKLIHIPQKDISSVSIEPIKKTSYLLIYTKDADKYSNVSDKFDAYNNQIIENIYNTPVNFDLSKFNLKNESDKKSLKEYVQKYASIKTLSEN